MADSLRDLCKKRGLSLLEVTERSGLDLTRVRAIYLERWTPSPAEREKIAQVLDANVDDIAWGHATPIQHLYGQGPA